MFGRRPIKSDVSGTCSFNAVIDIGADFFLIGKICVRDL